jgi:hypothetical protein
MDNLVFEEAVNAEISSSEFISKKWLYVNDSNAQNYTSQVVIDSTPLANSGGWINWSEGYIIFPLVVEIKSNTAGSIPASAAGLRSVAHSWAFKSGFWNIINSMTLEFNNQNCVQQTPFLNVFRSFKAHTSFSTDDLFNEGSTIGYYPDTAGSWAYATSNLTPTTSSLVSNGYGLSNNKQSPFLSANTFATGLATTTPFFVNTGSAGVLGVGTDNPSGFLGDECAFNEGMRVRSNWYGYTNQNAGGSFNQNAINNLATCNNVYRSSMLQQAGVGSAGFQIYAKLRLKDLSDFFLKCPLLKGSTIRFYINTNQATTSFTKTSATYNADGTINVNSSLSVNSVSVLGGLTNPLMVASADLGQGSYPLAADTYTLSLNIYKTTDGLYQTGLQSCRLYAPVYKMNPLAEQRYLQLAPTKRVEYNDIFQYQFSNIAGNNTSFNILVSNGISNIQSVLIVPFLNSSANPVSTTPLLLDTVLSPFSTSGATPDPITLTNINIQISGVNLFLNNQYYDYEQFNQELKSSNQLNGSLTTGLASGLINENMFSRGYRYYYGNASRILPSEEGVSRSVQIIGQNASLLACNLMVFVEFKRHMVIDIATGARIE